MPCIKGAATRSLREYTINHKSFAFFNSTHSTHSTTKPNNHQNATGQPHRSSPPSHPLNRFLHKKTSRPSPMQNLQPSPPRRPTVRYHNQLCRGPRCTAHLRRSTTKLLCLPSRLQGDKCRSRSFRSMAFAMGSSRGESFCQAGCCL